jgi:hypothetical protein
MQLAAAINQNLLGDERLKTEAENGFPQLVKRRLHWQSLRAEVRRGKLVVRPASLALALRRSCPIFRGSAQQVAALSKLVANNRRQLQ